MYQPYTSVNLFLPLSIFLRTFDKLGALASFYEGGKLDYEEFSLVTSLSSFKIPI